MTEPGREDRRRLVELCVVAASAMILTASYALVAHVDRERVELVASPDCAPDARAGGPAPGLVPASAPRRRVVVVRRSRPS